MKNLWRVIFLFVLPGIVAGGSSVNAFFRLADSDAELLKVLSYGAVLWCAAAWLTMNLWRRFKNISGIYYPAAAGMAVLFSLGIGVGRLLAVAGWIEGLIGIVFSGVSAGLIVQSLGAPTYQLRERIYFLWGILLAAALWITAAEKQRLSWMETCFFYCCELLLVTWLLASPLTCRSGSKRRWLWRTGLAAAALLAYFVTPVFSYRPWNPPPEAMNEGLWVKTSITPHGSRFTMMDKSGNTAVFTPEGRLTQIDRPDADMFPALICAAALMDKSNQTAILSAPARSHIPPMLKKIQCRLVRFHKISELGKFSFSKWLRNLWPANDSGLSNVDIFIMTALPEPAYPVVLRRFLQKNCSALHEKSVVVVSAELLKSPAVFSFLHEHFKYSAVLPAPGNVWCFTNQPITDRNGGFVKKLDAFLEKLNNEYSTLPAGLWDVVISSLPDKKSFMSHPEMAETVWSTQRVFSPVWFYLSLPLLFFIWRTVRLFGERRSILYSCWNSCESGFSAMGVFLLCLGLLVINSNCSILVLALLSLILALSLCKFSCGGVLGGLAGILLLLPAISGQQWGVVLLPAAMIQAAFLLGRSDIGQTFSVVQQQVLMRWTYLGMLIAAVLMLLVWMWSVPLLAVCLLFAAARLPGIWQSLNKRVY